MQATGSKPNEAQDRAYVEALLPEIQDVADGRLRATIAEIWVDCWREGPWERIEDVPKEPSQPTNSLVSHVRDVTANALALAEVALARHGVAYDKDLLLAGCLLHDVSKLVEYAAPREGGAHGHTHRGGLVQHAVYAAHKAWEKGLPDELAHIIVSHTPSSNTSPRLWEAVLLYYADTVDSEVLLHLAGRDLLLKR